MAVVGKIIKEQLCSHCLHVNRQIVKKLLNGYIVFTLNHSYLIYLRGYNLRFLKRILLEIV